MAEKNTFRQPRGRSFNGSNKGLRSAGNRKDVGRGFDIEAESTEAAYGEAPELYIDGAICFGADWRNAGMELVDVEVKPAKRVKRNEDD